ncbi:MAG: YncE family protein, partial [Actinomycetota bacterium]
DADLQEAMGGTARIQAASPDGRRLYTLYTLPGPEDGEDYAFIHVLSLDELWAHCIDLPAGFATSAESATALTVSPDGRRLYVANGATRTLAEIDTEALEVARTSTLDLGSGGIVHGAHDPDSTLYLARGRRVVAVDASGLTQRRAWVMPEKVRGLQVTPDARRLYVGLRQQVAVLDTVTGDRLEMIDPPGVRWIDQFGPVTRSVDPGRTEITCAC